MRRGVIAITGEHIYRFQYINYEKENIPPTIANYLCEKLEDVESKHVAAFKECTKIFLNILV